jgi:hypothetical protein
LDPKPSQISLEDIAYALSRVPRFNGHTENRSWSVAEHSVLVADLVLASYPQSSPGLILGALLHDAHEAYLGDRVRPVKLAVHHLLRRGDFAGQRDPFEILADRLDDAIHRSLGLVLSTDDRVKIRVADAQALRLERESFMPESPEWGQDLPSPPSGFTFCHRVGVGPSTPEAVRLSYLHRANFMVFAQNQKEASST